MADGFANLNGAVVHVTNNALDVNVGAGAGGGAVSISQTTPGTTNGVQVNDVKGAANVAVAQLTTSTTAATLVVARPTRRGVTIRNHDTAISVYVGPATVTAANGLLLKAGESVYVTWVGLIQVIAASGTPVVGTWDEYA